MYESSAKCNANLGEDITSNLEDTEDGEVNEELTCKFIKDAILGHIDENGFVYAGEGSGNSPMQGFWNWATNAATEDPQFVTSSRVSSDSVSAGQTTALTLGAIGTAAMGAAAYMLKQQVDAMDGTEGLIANGDKQLD